jgi:hypothetical protein
VQDICQELGLLSKNGSLPNSFLFPCILYQYDPPARSPLLKIQDPIEGQIGLWKETKDNERIGTRLGIEKRSFN